MKPYGEKHPDVRTRKTKANPRRHKTARQSAKARIAGLIAELDHGSADDALREANRIRATAGWRR